MRIKWNKMSMPNLGQILVSLAAAPSVVTQGFLPEVAAAVPNKTFLSDCLSSTNQVNGLFYAFQK